MSRQINRNWQCITFVSPNTGNELGGISHQQKCI
uniref:Uncharacterized protein n=1 Tax=Anguilla anguilla TaxID=7936 RepID=A0A0E9V1H2_ANGAN